MMMNQISGSEISMHTLSNGIRIIHRECSGEVSCCGLVVNAGTRNELENEQGLAHFTEHMIFKGTKVRNPRHILNRMEMVGGELNAYTTKEEIFIYSIFLRKDYERAIDLLSDMFFNSTFPEEEIEKEKDVILDEINSYEDSPSELIFDDFDQLLFPGNQIGRKILGEPECLKSFKTNNFCSFHSRNFTTDSIVFFSQSALPIKKIITYAEKHLGKIKSSERNTIYKCIKPEAVSGVRKIIQKDTHQSHVIYGNINYSLFEEEDRMGMYFLNNILGGPGLNSRLNIALRERSGLVYSVESNVTSFTDSGVFSIYFGTDPEQTERCISIVEKELKKLREVPLSDLQLKAARKQLYGQIMISSENKENQSLSMGKSMLYFNSYDSMEEIKRKIELITPQKLVEIARNILDPDKMSMLIYK
jgi:predicted Zn-dependent peptidase